MQPLFPPWADTALRVALFAAAAGVVGFPLLAMAWVRSPYATGKDDAVDQPVQFDHRHHVRDDGIDCLYCHHDATRSSYAGVPATDLCMNCHSQVWQRSQLLAPVRASWFDEKPLVWTRVHALPQHVFFDHAAHTNRGVGCASCHGRVDQMAMARMQEPLTMGWCIGCHRDPARALRPQSEITNMDYVPRLDEGARIAKERGIAPPLHCSGCHR